MTVRGRRALWTTVAVGGSAAVVLGPLAGLAGTLIGLRQAHGAVASPGVDPSLKAQMLAEGISAAMNCTAYGLIAGVVAVPVALVGIVQLVRALRAESDA